LEPDALAAGFEKLAHVDSAGALDLLPLLLTRQDLTPAVQSRLQRAAALGAAYDHDPRALSAFQDLAADAVDVQVEGMAGACGVVDRRLRQGAHLARTNARKSGHAASWRYWRARATAATAGDEAATPLDKEIADLRDYYGYLAATRLQSSYHLNARPSPDDRKAQAALAAETGLIRAHELFDCDMADEAVAEWNAALAGAEPKSKVQAAHLAARWGWHFETIAMLAQAAEWDDVRLRYRARIRNAVATPARSRAYPPTGFLRHSAGESVSQGRSIARRCAWSHAMLPATAVAVARRWHLPLPRRESCSMRSVAVPLGAAYLRELLNRFTGQLVPALAAYNAGPTPVARWLPPNRRMPMFGTENIPYAETRGYVQHITEHIVAFAYVSDAEPPRLRCTDAGCRAGDSA